MQLSRNVNVACIDVKAENGQARMYVPPFLPPAGCASKLITRADDTEEVVKEMLRIYNDMVRTITFEANLNTDLVWTLEQIQQNIDNHKYQHVDARSKARANHWRNSIAEKGNSWSLT